jgi:hypothetical protein
MAEHRIRTTRKLLGRGLVVAILGSLSTAGLSAAPAASSAGGPLWQVIPTPNVGTSRNVLRDVATLSSDDAWAVGSFFDAEAQADRSLIQHWDGRAWKIVPAPTVGTGYQSLWGVSALSPRDVWAVGRSSERFGPDRPMILRWNGRRWRVFEAPEFENWSALEDVSAVSEREAWAVGNSYQGSFIIRWDGRSWRTVPSPNVGWLASIHAISSSNIWVVGQRGAAGGAVYKPLIQHWDGTRWTEVPSPSPPAVFSILEDVSGRSDDLAWAVGSAWDGGGPQRPIIERWDGAEWRLVPGPVVEEGELLGVVGVSATEAWAVGRAGSRTLIARWDGVGWSAVDPPSPGINDRLIGVSALLSGEAWAVGALSDTIGERTLALRHLP